MKDDFFRTCENIIGSGNIDVTADPPVLYPSGEESIREVIRCIRSGKHTMQIVGGGTYPVPPCSTGAIRISTKALSAISEVNPDDYLMIVQAGVLIDDAAYHAETAGLYMPLDITSGDRATIGGAYMTNAVGPSMTGYGAFRNSVTGVRCIDAQGDIVTFGGRTAKNVTGYDITHFLSGTMGLYVLAVELILKVYPMPEKRVMIEALFPPRSKPFDTLNEVISGLPGAKRFEFIADGGLGGEISIAVGFEGMNSLVSKCVGSAREMMHHAGVEKIRLKKYETFTSKRRKAARSMTGPEFYTFSIPPSSSGIFMEKINAVSPKMPVIAHPSIGRFHLVCSDNDQIESLRETSLALGGKQPVGWGSIRKKGIAALFTKQELSVARALKHEIDPSGIFNAHMGMND